MEGINCEYARRLQNYIIAMNFFEGLLNKDQITIHDYIEIEQNIAHKYKMENSIFRMEKSACDYKKDNKNCLNMFYP